jgi:hypothetical protein
MAAPVRPPVWPPAPSTIKPGANDARATAQKAFFQAAMAGKAVQPPPAAPVSAPAAPATAARDLRASTPREEPAEGRIPRPGSIIDIWV